MVKPTTEELESFNQLIHIDHSYYCNAPPPTVEVEVELVDSCTKDGVQLSSDTNSVANDQLANRVAEISDDFLNSLSASQLLELTETLGQFFPGDELLNTNISSDKLIEKNCDSFPSVCQMDIGHNTLGDWSLADSFCPDVPVVDTNLCSPSSSGYGTSPSYIGSPISDSLYDDWQESFTELFPALV